MKESFTKKIGSVIVTAVVLTMLLLAGPANAMNVTITAPSSSNPVWGEVVEFDAQVEILTNEHVPITSMSVAFSDLSICYFEVDGSLLSGCEGVTVTPTGSSAGYGYGYGYNAFPGYGYGYGYGYGQGQLSYHITVNTSRFAPGTVLLWYQANYNANPSQSSNAGNINVDSSTVSMTVEQPADALVLGPNSTNINLLINSTLTHYLDLSLIPETGGTITLPQITLTRNVSGQVFTVEIPAGTVLTVPSGWNKRIMLPEESLNLFTISSGSVNLVVDLGSNVELAFSSPVKITLPGQAGKAAAWAGGTTSLTPITTTCNSLTSPTNINTVSPRECKIDSGSDLVIYTTHFTSFGSYTATPASPGSSGGNSKSSRGFGPLNRPSQAKPAPEAAAKAIEKIPEEVTFDGPPGKEEEPVALPTVQPAEGNEITGAVIGQTGKTWAWTALLFVAVVGGIAGFYHYKKRKGTSEF